VTLQFQQIGLWAPRLDPAHRIVPFLKWPGGKSEELPVIAASSPPLTRRIIDPFVGGGSVWLAAPPEVPAIVNDACRDLMALYRAAARRDSAYGDAMISLAVAWDRMADLDEVHADLAKQFKDTADERPETWIVRHRARLAALLEPAGQDLMLRFVAEASRLITAKFQRMRRLESSLGGTLSEDDALDNVEGAVRSVVYDAVRARYNEARLAGRFDAVRSADFFLLRALAMNSMFRFNASGEFNVPYGGVSYNRQPLLGRVASMFSSPMFERLANTTLHCQDFEPFLAKASPKRDDFVFVDPPYESQFSTYDGLQFGPADQVRLRDVLESLPSRVMVVIKDTPTIRRLYESGRWQVAERAKTYAWTIKSRNDREATHLMITNY
jgi:DNA adenine methylase